MPVESAGRWWALGALALCLLAVGLDTTVLNTALPTLSTTLGASTSELQWITDSYNLVLAALLLPAGLLGDRYGRKKLIMGALAVFGAGSVWSAYSTSPGELMAARAVLGVGAAFLIPLVVAGVLVLFEPTERPRAIAVVTLGSLVGIPLGPIAGGLLLHSFWWGSVFLINAPVAAVGLIAVATLLPESRNPDASGLDPFGIALSAAGMVGVTYGVIEAGERGWTDVRSLGPLVGGAVILGLFVVVERHVARTRDALVDLALFRARAYTAGTILVTIMAFALFGVLFNTPQYLRAVLGADSLGTGLRLLPMLGAMVVGVQVATRVVQRIGPKAIVTVGLLITSAGLFLGAFTTAATSYGEAAVWFALFGLGVGLSIPTATLAAVGSLDTARAGAGSALVFATRQLGSSVGVAILGTLALSRYRGGLDLSAAAGNTAARASVTSGVAVAQRLHDPALLTSVRTAFVHGMDLTLWLCGGISLAGAGLALAILPGRARPPATPVVPSQASPSEPALTEDAR
ncbi:MFS transporter [Frankia sp. AgB1.9]|uniref:MFS transporter n=1 Tax=unclassified Frankia TaxID=2632575 RepID=UPI001931A601|nr:MULTISPECIES: MFS transporter [unclassified Frankia]MBL7486877.1 MFS transporter [Frankia sp. AgW1.1]MBL7547236.1 MFS transporter [Frankia sp. AgB1.9]MBL7623972.1 MFS transporter [Frankia sp. AgB1.8]